MSSESSDPRPNQPGVAVRPFRDFVDHLPEAVLLVRGEWILHANPRLEWLLGVKPGSLVGRACDSFIAPDDRAAFRERLWAVESEARVVEPARSGWLRADGTPFTVSQSLSAIELDDGRAIVLVARDNALTRALLERSEQLDRMVAVTTLAAGVGHEINNPMAYVTSNLSEVHQELEALRQDLAARCGAAEGAAGALDVPAVDARLASMLEMVADARQGADRVREIVLSLRPLSSGSETARQFVDVADVLETALSLAGDALLPSVVVSRDYREVPPVKASEARLLQVFGSLLANASQAVLPVGHRSRELRLRVDTTEENVVVEFEDTGVGMTEAVLARAFDPFYTTRAVGQGRGLGLFLVQSAVRSWGGEVTATSVPGEGTCVRVVLPAAPVARRTPPPRFEAVRRRVLLIDDEATVVRALRRTLLAHHEVIESTSARDALLLIRSGARVDAVLCDLVMPEVNGVQFVDALRSTNADLAQRVILMTGGTGSATLLDEARRSGCLVLDKPFTTLTLLDALHGCFGH